MEFLGLSFACKATHDRYSSIPVRAWDVMLERHYMFFFKIIITIISNESVGALLYILVGPYKALFSSEKFRISLL